MPSFEVQFRPSLDVLARRFGSVNAREFLGEQITKLAFETEREAKLETPVDKGGLRASISTSLSLPFGAQVRPHVPYAHWIHEGWMDRGGRRVRIRGGGSAGTPIGGKPYMELGAQRAVVSFEDRMARLLEQRIQAKINRV